MTTPASPVPMPTGLPAAAPNVPVPTGLNAYLDRVSQTASGLTVQGNNALQPINFSSVQSGTNYNTSTGIWTAPFSGICTVNAIVTIGSVPAGGYAELRLLQHGTTVVWGGMYTQSGPSDAYSVGIHLERSVAVGSGDQLTLALWAIPGNLIVGCPIYSDDFTAASFSLIAVPSVS